MTSKSKEACRPVPLTLARPFVEGRGSREVGDGRDVVVRFLKRPEVDIGRRICRSGRKLNEGIDTLVDVVVAIDNGGVAVL